MSTDSLVERWRPIPGYEVYYEASDQGRIRSLDRVTRNGWGPCRRKGQILRPLPMGQRPHLQVFLSKDGVAKRRAIHRLVLMAFVGLAPSGTEACHNNGDARDNRLENLRWDTTSSNRFDSIRHGTNRNARKTHCPRNHEYTPDNTYRTRNRNSRMCRQCVLARQGDKRRLAKAALGGVVTVAALLLLAPTASADSPALLYADENHDWVCKSLDAQPTFQGVLSVGDQIVAKSHKDSGFAGEVVSFSVIYYCHQHSELLNRFISAALPRPLKGKQV